MRFFTFLIELPTTGRRSDDTCATRGFGKKAIMAMFIMLATSQFMTASVPSGSIIGGSVLWDGSEQPTFSRSYVHKRPEHLVHKSLIHRKSRLQRATEIAINHEALSDHLALDKIRHAVLANSSENQTITMNAGEIDLDGETPQTWVMPDLNQFAPSFQSIDHIDWASTGWPLEYPDQTHAFYIPSTDAYAFYELNQDELFFYGFGHKNDDDEFDFTDWYLTMAPVPIEWGLEFEGTVMFIYEEDPDYDSVVFVQHYEAVADGTLDTYDEGPVDAVKLHFTEEITGYKDGEEVDYEEYHEVVWYSVQGHYVRGLLAEGASFTGSTEFDEMRYQKISQSVSTDPAPGEDGDLELFPNPVSAGEVLTISHDTDRHYGLIQLYDMQGRLMHQVDMTGMGAVRHFQIQLPSQLEAGIYVYRALAPSGTPLGHGKLNVH